MSSSNPIDRLFGAVVPRAVDAVDIDSVVGQVDLDKLIAEVDMDKVLERVDVEKLIERIDLNLLLERVDLTVLLQRIDLDALIGRLDIDAVVQQVDIDGVVKKVDINGIVQQVDIDGIVQQVDIDGIVKRVDIDGIVKRVDINGIVQQVDVDAIIGQVDMPTLMKRAQIDVIVSNASRGVFTRILDALRRQLAGVDIVLIGVVDRIFRRPRELDTVADGAVTGHLAGGISRLAAFGVDAATIAASYSLIVGLGLFLAGLFSGERIDVNGSELWYGIGYLTFGFLYYWVGLTITGRSIGKGVVGLRVVGKDDRPIGPGQAAVRTIVYPISIILLGLGLIPIVTGKRRRALHDAAAGTVVVYDWGDRPSEIPAPVTNWLRRHDIDAGPPDTIPAASPVASVSPVSSVSPASSAAPASSNGSTVAATDPDLSTNGTASSPSAGPPVADVSALPERSDGPAGPADDPASG